MLILRGGCRRELDVPSGAWQYVWSFRAGASDATVDNRRGYNVSGRGHPSSSAGGGKGGVTEEGLFRSWYPPALLKNETLPSPRAAVRRVEGEERKREARLALAKSLLDDQRGQALLSQRRCATVESCVMSSVHQLRTAGQRLCQNLQWLSQAGLSRGKHVVLSSLFGRGNTCVFTPVVSRIYSHQHHRPKGVFPWLIRRTRVRRNLRNVSPLSPESI